MKIYTKTGDKGMTSLFGGQRVSKADNRIAAYGTMDELNALLGVVVAELLDTQPDHATKNIITELQTIQRDLFSLGSHLATPYEAGLVPPHLPTLPVEHIPALEKSIDHLEAGLAPLRNFILPGGSLPGSHLHVARTVCRRAERACITLQTNTQPAGFVAPEIIMYLNRLSDWLFVAARWVNQQSNSEEITWSA